MTLPCVFAWLLSPPVLHLLSLLSPLSPPGLLPTFHWLVSPTTPGPALGLDLRTWSALLRPMKIPGSTSKQVEGKKGTPLDHKIQARQSFFSKIINENISNSKVLFSTVDRLINPPSTIPSHLLLCGNEAMLAMLAICFIF